MSAEQLVHRIICSQAEVESDKIKTGALDGLEYQRIVSSVSEIQKHVMIIDDQAGLKITDLRARARRMKESYGIGLLIIDYLQLISGSGTNRTAKTVKMRFLKFHGCLKIWPENSIFPFFAFPSFRVKSKSGKGIAL